MPGGGKQFGTKNWGKLKIKLSLYLIILIFLFFPNSCWAENVSCQIAIFPSQVEVGKSFAVFIKISGLLQDKNYQYSLWVYGGKPLSSIWNGSSFASSYTYLDIPQQQIENGIFQEWVILKINSLPNSGYDYYLKLRIREKNTSSYLCEDIKYHLEDNFNILDDSVCCRGLVLGKALNEDGEPLEGGMAAVLGENLEYLSIAPCGSEGDFSLPLLWGEDYYFQVYDNEALPLSQVVPFSLGESNKNLGNLFLKPPSPPPEIKNLEALNIGPESFTVFWQTSQDYFLAQLKILDQEGRVVFFKNIKDNSVLVENLQPQTQYKIVLTVFSYDFLTSEKEILTQTLSKTYPEGIYINEIFPHPESSLSDEFIEIFNSNNFEVDLSFWKIKDGMGTTREYVFPQNTKISPLKFLVLRREETGIILNDDGDFVILLAPDNTVKDKSPPYQNAPLNFAFARFASDWQWTAQPTPLAPNIFKSTDQEEKNSSNQVFILPIAEAKKLKENTLVACEGFVEVLPGVLGSQIFYLQDESGGIQIYSKAGVFPSFVLGQKIKVEGRLNKAYGEWRIVVDELQSIQILPQIVLPSYLSLSLSQISDEFVGRLVKVSGKVSKTSGSVFYISDGSNILKVYVKPTTGIKKPKIKKGAKVVIFGLLSKTTSGFRLLPCYQKDIIVKQVVQDNLEEENITANTNRDIPTVKAASASDIMEGLPVSSQTKKELRFLEILGWLLLAGGFTGIVALRLKKIKI